MTIFLCLLSAALLAASQLTPWGFLALFGYAPLIYVTYHRQPAKVFKIVFWTTVIQYMASLYWLIIAITVFGNLHLAIGIVALFLVSTILACYIAGAAMLARYLNLHLGWSYGWLFAIALSATEYLRNYGFIGAFPWGNAGNSLATVPVLLQGASIVGVYGMVFYIGLVGAGICALKAPALGRSVFWAALFSTLGLSTYGAWRLYNYDHFDLPAVKIALLQGNIEQGIKNQAALYSDEILERYQSLQEEAVRQGAQISIWPETAYPYRLLTEKPRLENLGPLAPINIIGTIAIDRSNQFYNSAYILKQNGELAGHFAKSHLVPFGEYVPWPFGSVVDRLVPGLGAFGRGVNLNPIKVDGLSLAITICYEGIFPEIGREFVKNGAELLINITNDAWYGYSAGPYQHLAMYQLRSVEVSRSYARATNTGVSAWVDPVGYLHQSTPLYEEALVVADVPISTETTYYLRWGDIVPQLCLLLLFIGLMIVRRPKCTADWIAMFLGLAIILAAHVYFKPMHEAMQESALTKETLFWFLGLLIGFRRKGH